jgi:hypothetical protein
VTGRQGRRRRKLLDELKERRGYSHLKEEALDRTMWRARFGRSFGPVVRQTTKGMNVRRKRRDVIWGEGERNLPIVEMLKTQRWRQELLKNE